MPLSVVILAAGKGTRMRSDLPKVLQPLAGRPLLQHVVDTAARLEPARLRAVVGHGADRVRETITGPGLEWIVQAEQLGTGHAVLQALPGLDDADSVLVLYGDVPLVREETMRGLAAWAREGALALLGAELDDPDGYGRILRDDGGRVAGIVEEKDATAAQRGIREINTGLMAGPAGQLRRWLERVGNDNAQGEYYLTDVAAMARRDGCPLEAVAATDPDEILGVNDRVQLAHLERVFQRRQARALMRAGVLLLDPERFDLRGRLETGRDVTIDVNAVFEGEVVLGDGVRVGPNCHLRDCRLGNGVELLPNTVVDGATVGTGARLGPFSRIRPGTELADGTHIGNFVEIKQSRVGTGSKINHLSYVGDTEMGRGVNIGAGTITCNYDGVHKHRTEIGDDAFVGSGTELVAPVRVGAGATIGAGSTISKDAPEGQLTVGRARQTTVPGWKRPDRKR
ncbi:MAG TPA: bifunctional UDP-N-acetylglucosamine diphosphorylase/glucosamine-1-phosphate N-acetyltransferase GlmU [Gammaproteobacteria bacterium]|nr:bifunctional UDP-N-acetylglucosamine diphosphorylase/glucosamine-1-phosphate N-acetyltransferase GlmU [Gammaproteobacteria bacterium]